MMVRGRVVLLPAPNEDKPMTNKPEISPEEVMNLKTFMLHHVGSNNRVSPERLAEYLYGKPTANNIRKARQVRREINADESNNLLICTDRDQGGFYLASGDDMEEVSSHIAEEASIAARELEKVSAMKRKARRMYPDYEGIEGQGRLF